MAIDYGYNLPYIDGNYYTGGAMAETIFSDDAKLIEASHRYIDVRERLKKAAQTDPTQTPTPTRIAAEMKMSLDELLELADFAENYLGDFETAYIMERSGEFYDLESGRRITTPS